MISNSSSLPADCRRWLTGMDAETPPQGWQEHVATCEACAQEREVRNRMKNRVRSAHESIAVPIGLETRIRAAIAGEQDRKPDWFRAPVWLAATCALAVLGGFGIAYQLGHLRLTSAAQDSYIASVSTRVASILRVGLKDHIHCAVYRKFSKTPPPVEALVADLGPQYGELAQVVRQQAPAGYQVVIGHKCRYEGRQFVHLALRNQGGQLLSLVIARKHQGESFQTERIPAARTSKGTPFFEAQTQRFAISAFETGEHLVYTVSGLPAHQNMGILVAMAPQVSQVLARVEL